jgi:hypothetical protein
MPTINTHIVLILFSLLLCSVATWRSIMFKKKVDEQTKLLAETNENLEEARRKLLDVKKIARNTKGFNDSLSQAEITTRLQKSRLSTQSHNRGLSPPERYRYVHSLATTGMSPQEIATVLSISIHESNQLVNLSKLAHPK